MPKVAPPLAQPGAAACHRVSTSDASFTRAINVSVGDAPHGAVGEAVTLAATKSITLPGSHDFFGWLGMKFRRLWS